MSNSILTLGVLSGTSVDAIDLALVEWQGSSPTLLAHAEFPWETSLQKQLLTLPESPHISLQTLGQLHTACGQAFTQAILAFMQQYKVKAQDVAVIGSHGQTIWHYPEGEHPFSLQLGHPAIIAKQTAIPTAADFRMDDIALGGQGAPLAPLLHRKLFAQPQETVAVLNLGGIANLSIIFPDGQTIGFDTGPANTLLDAWYRLHHTTDHLGFDRNGNWAASGQLNQDLVAQLLQHPFFQKNAPKSTGREDFSLSWLQEQLVHSNKTSLSPSDIQASLLQLTVESIVAQLESLTTHQIRQLWLCGGGAYNSYFIDRLSDRLDKTWQISTTDIVGYPSSALEGILFAYLGYMRLQNIPLDLTQITGQKRSGIVGGLWLP